MAGELVPLVLIPRYTTFAGNDTFTTIGMDVTEYQSAIINLWVGVVAAGAGNPTVTFEESTDQNSWTSCSATTGSNPDTPGPSSESPYQLTLTKRWFRVKVVLGGVGNVQTFWAVGSLEERTT